MKKTFLVGLFVIVLISIPVGYIGCDLFLCYFTLPITTIVAFIVAMVTVLRIFLIKRYSPLIKIISLLVIPAYILGSLLLPYIIWGLVIAQRIKTERIERKDKVESLQEKIPHIVKITPQGSNLVYSCELCGFRFKFPSYWKYQTKIVSFPYNQNLVLNISLNTDANLADESHNSELKEIVIDSSPITDLSFSQEDKYNKYTNPLAYTIENVKLNGNHFQISKKIATEKNQTVNESIFIISQSNNRYLTVKTSQRVAFEKLDPKTSESIHKLLNTIEFF